MGQVSQRVELGWIRSSRAKKIGMASKDRISSLCHLEKIKMCLSAPRSLIQHWSSSSSSSSCSCSSWVTLHPKSLSHFKSVWDEIWQECYSPKYASTNESDFWFDVTLSRWRPWRDFTQKSAAAWWMNTKHIPGAYAAASVSSWSIVHSYLLQHHIDYYCLLCYSVCLVSIGDDGLCGVRCFAGKSLSADSAGRLRTVS